MPVIGYFDIMLKNSSLIAIALLALFNGACSNSNDKELNLVLQWRDIIIKGHENETDPILNINLEGLSELNEKKIRKKFFRWRPFQKIKLNDVSQKKEYKKFRDLDSENHAYEYSLEFVEWKDNNTVIVKTSSQMAPLWGAGGTKRTEFKEGKWKHTKQIESVVY